MSDNLHINVPNVLYFCLALKNKAKLLINWRVYFVFLLIQKCVWQARGVTSPRHFSSVKVQASLTCVSLDLLT